MELLARMAIMTDSAVVGKPHPADAILAIGKTGGIAGQHQIRLAGGKGFRLQFLTKEFGRPTLTIVGGKFLNAFLGNRQNTTGTASPVVDAVALVLEGRSYRQNGQVGQQTDVVARRIVFSGFRHAEVFIEFPEQFFKQRTHGVVVQCRQLFAQFFLTGFFVQHRFHHRSGT